ncbi:hypothetical protein IFR04_000959 [Cadophora malorum]|uniref:Uncharacterized protein n=1 Tax=Cadophora malorum TaxID=108018 RepID=A0A8H7WJF9_9HELO|nr:hypothetical protein IFR04_000959 [Cadophora malorum]
MPPFSETDIMFAIEHLDVPSDKKRDLPIIFVMSEQNIGIHEKLEQYYSDDKLSRFGRLEALPHWVFVDLFSFTRWDTIWSTTALHSSRLRDEVYGDKAAIPFLEQTLALHRYKETIIAQTECLIVHVAFVNAYKTSFERMKEHRRGPELPDLHGLVEKLVLIEGYLAHHQCYAERYLRVIDVLLSLAFNLETVKQRLQFKRLSYLAVVFLPLALVAAIFGMNNIVLQPQDYGQYAILALLGTIVVAFSSEKIFSWCEIYLARRARAKEARVLDEESSGSYYVPL